MKAEQTKKILWKGNCWQVWFIKAVCTRDCCGAVVRYGIIEFYKKQFLMHIGGSAASGQPNPPNMASIDADIDI